MKRIAPSLLVLAALALAALPACKTMSSGELKASIEVLDYSSSWVSKYYQPWPPRLILVPQISFRIKNVGSKPLSYVNFNAVFQFKGDPENFGDAFMAAIRGQAVPPGGTSDLIVLKTQFLENLPVRDHLLLGSLINDIDPQFTRAQGNDLRGAPGYDPDANSGSLDEFEAMTIFDIKHLRLDPVVIVNNPAIGEYAVHIQQQQPYFGKPVLHQTTPDLSRSCR